MSQEQNLFTEPDAPEHDVPERDVPEHDVPEHNVPEHNVPEHNVRRTLLSPWMQRRFEQLNARGLSLTSTGQPLTLTRRSSRAMGATLTKPRIGALTPGLVEHFSHTIAARTQTMHLAAIRRPIALTRATAPVKTPTWDSNIELVLPGGSTTATGQMIERFPTGNVGTFTIGQPIEPFRPAPSLPTRAARPASAKPVPQPTRPTARKQLPAQARLYTRVEEIAPQDETPMSTPQTALSADTAGLPFAETYFTADHVARSQPSPVPAMPPSAPSAMRRPPAEPQPTTTGISIAQASEPAPQTGLRPAPIHTPATVQRTPALSRPPIALPTTQQPAKSASRPRGTETAPEPSIEITEHITAAPPIAQRESAPEPSQPIPTASIAPGVTPTRVTARPDALEMAPVTPPSIIPPGAEPLTTHETIPHSLRAVAEPIHPARPRTPQALPVEPPASSRIQRSADALRQTTPESHPESPVVPQAPHPSTLTPEARPIMAAPEAEDFAPHVDVQQTPEHLTGQVQTHVVPQPTAIQTRPSAEMQPSFFATTLPASRQPVTPPTVVQTTPTVAAAEDMRATPFHIATSPAVTETAGEEINLPLHQAIRRRADTRSHGLIHAPALTPALQPVITRAPHQAKPARPQATIQIQKPTQKWETAADKMHAPSVPTTSPRTQRPRLTVATSPTLYARGPDLYIGPGRLPTVSQKRLLPQAQHHGHEGEPSRDLQKGMQALLHPETPLILPPIPRPASSITVAGLSTSTPRGAATPPERADYPDAMPLARQEERQQTTAAPAQISRSPVRMGEAITRPAAVGELIQRAPVVQSTEREDITPESIDLVTLARRVYPLIKRLIAVERERTRNF